MSLDVGALGKEPNKNLAKKIMMSVSSIGRSDFCVSNTELDYHYNMVVIRSQSFVFSHSGQYANVRAFTEEVQVLPKVLIVDKVIVYYFLYSGETYLLVFSNSLCVPLMDHNFVPPFVLRESGLILNDKPKIHCEDPSFEDHSLLDD